MKKLPYGQSLGTFIAENFQISTMCNKRQTLSLHEHRVLPKTTRKKIHFDDFEISFGFSHIWMWSLYMMAEITLWSK